MDHARGRGGRVWGLTLLLGITPWAGSLGTPPAAPGPAPIPPAEAGQSPEVPRLSETSRAEQETLRRLAAAPAWPRRALAVLRLERYVCAESRARLETFARDDSWQVRAFAVQTLGRRRSSLPPGFFDGEPEPRVLRTALRHGYGLDLERLRRGIRRLAGSADLADRLLAAELGAASGDPDLLALARTAARSVILRMGRAEAGAFSPRLAVLTGERDLRRASRWRHWLLKKGRSFAVGPGHAVDAGGAGGAGGSAPGPRSLIARLDPDRFAALEAYIETLADRHVDLAICLDCTASMSGELTAAQGGVDDLMLFVGDVIASLRIGLVAYRDRNDREFETKGWEFTESLDEARDRLWQLSADGGGDTREAVHPGLKLAYTGLSWMPEHVKVLILIGDAPPHAGYGVRCVEMARRAQGNGLTTHVIQAEGKEVEHFAAIAEAGGGACVDLADDAQLVVEIAGLTLGDTFGQELRELFGAYLTLCR